MVEQYRRQARIKQKRSGLGFIAPDPPLRSVKQHPYNVSGHHLDSKMVMFYRVLWIQT